VRRERERERKKERGGKNEEKREGKKLNCFLSSTSTSQKNNNE